MNNIDKKINEIINSEKTKLLLNKIYQSKNVFPKQEDVFKCFSFFNISNIKVLIIGQDPYYTRGVADGLAFSTKNNKTPPSLINIFHEIKNEYKDASFKTNDLSCWAKQGVLLLNSSLTVEENKPNSHSEYWFWFIKEILSIISKVDNVVIMLWGNNSIKLKEFINNKTHLILTSSHPSPLSAHKGFLGNNHFIKANNFLKSKNKTIIDWSTFNI